VTSADTGVFDDVGFSDFGCYGSPIRTPAIENPAYFGSWDLSHRIPRDCKADILNAKYIWFSHGHPDHLNTGSLKQLRGKNILLGDHVGGAARDIARATPLRFNSAVISTRCATERASRSSFNEGVALADVFQRCRQTRPLGDATDLLREHLVAVEPLGTWQ
jgi:hypothetical protein